MHKFLRVTNDDISSKTQRKTCLTFRKFNPVLPWKFNSILCYKIFFKILKNTLIQGNPVPGFRFPMNGLGTGAISSPRLCFS